MQSTIHRSVSYTAELQLPNRAGQCVEHSHLMELTLVNRFLFRNFEGERLSDLLDYTLDPEDDLIPRKLGTVQISFLVRLLL